jgi:hypothetical protein
MMIVRSSQVVFLIPALAHFFSHTERYHQHSNDAKAPWHLTNWCLTNRHLINGIVIPVFCSTCHLLRKIFIPKLNRSTICFLISHLSNCHLVNQTFAQRAFWTTCHLSKKSFGQGDIYFTFRLSKTSSAEKLVRMSQTMSTAWLQPHLNTDTSGLIL